jgi:small subunit ribosomal protein S21
MTRIYKKEELSFRPLEISVYNGNFEDAFRKFKTIVQNEGIVAEFKSRGAYEKPSERKRRKRREAEERRLLTASREALIASGEWEKRQKKKEQKRAAKVEERKKQQEASLENL